jgi:hypothetical protein
MDFCKQCSRRVHNLDGMSEAERQMFFTACSGEVCVAYTVRHPRALAGVLGIAAALGGGMTALAQDVAPAVVTGPTCDPNAKSLSIETIVVGGTTASRDVQWIDESEAKVPDAPEIGEIEAADWLPTPQEAKTPE